MKGIHDNHSLTNDRRTLQGILSLLNVEMFGIASAGSTAKSNVEWQIPACDVSHAINCLYDMLCVLNISNLCGVYV